MNDVKVVATDPAGGHDSGGRGDRGFGDAGYVCVVGVLGLELGGADPVGRDASSGPVANGLFKQASAKGGVVEAGEGSGGALADLFGMNGMEQYRIPGEQIKAILDPPDGSTVGVRNLLKSHAFFGVGNSDDFRFFEGGEIVALQVLRGADGPCGMIIAFNDLSGNLKKAGHAGCFAAIAAGDCFVACGDGSQDKRDDYSMLLDGCRELLDAYRISFEALLIGGAVMNLFESNQGDWGRFNRGRWRHR